MNLIENFNSTNQSFPYSLGHDNFIVDLKEDDCHLVEHLVFEHRCAYVKLTESCSDEVKFIDYVYFLYCIINARNIYIHYLGVGLILIMAIYMFGILGTTADKFFCPALTVLSKMMKMSESLAGVTLVAFGNGSPDLFTALAQTSEDTAMLYSELLGAGAFITGVIAGAIIIIQPFKLFGANFLRDALFYIFGCLWIDFAMANNEISFIESCVIIGLYLLYLTVVIIDQILVTQQSKKIQQKMDEQKGQNRADLINTMDELKQQGTIELKVRHSTASLDILDTFRAPFIGVNTNDHIFSQFFKSLNPIDIEQWNESGCISKTLMILKVPIIFILLLILPIVDYNEPVHGWSKLLNTLQIIILPISCLILEGKSDIQYFGIPILMYSFVITTPFAIAVFFTSRTDIPPKYHVCFAIGAAIGSVVVISAFASEVVNVLSTFGIVSSLSPSFLGSTVLAWGNSIGDLISNITLARQGYERMGFAACYGGPLFNTLLGLGVVFLFKSIASPTGISMVRQGSMGPNCLIFLLLILCFTLFAVCLTKFNARRSIGFLTFAVYGLFIIYGLLGELEIIHPYGCDHHDQRVRV